MGLVPDQSPTQLERATREAVAGGRLNAPMLAREEEGTELPLADGGSDASRQERCAPKQPSELEAASGGGRRRRSEAAAPWRMAAQPCC